MLAGNKTDGVLYDTRLHKVQADLQRATHAKTHVEEKLQSAIKIGQRAHAILAQADKKQSELEAEIERLKRQRDASEWSSTLVDSAVSLYDRESDRFEGLLAQLKVLGEKLEQSRSDLTKTQDLRRGVSRQLLNAAHQSSTEVSESKLLRLITVLEG